MTHLSSMQIDAAALAGEPPEHLKECAECTRRWDEAAAARETFRSEILPKTSGRVRQRLAGRARTRWFAVFSAASAMAIVAIARQNPEYTAKGDFHLQLFAERDGKVIALEPGDKVRAEDRIMPRCLPPRSELLLVSVSERGRTWLYDASVAPGQLFQPPNALMLDAEPGPERLFAIASDEPIAREQVEALLQKLVTAEDIRRTTRLGFGQETSVLLERAP